MNICLLIYLALEFEWYLGMNLYPDDGHIMDFLTGWDDEYDIGNATTAFTKDYLNQRVWKMLVNRIAIVRHQEVRTVVTS